MQDSELLKRRLFVEKMFLIINRRIFLRQPTVKIIYQQLLQLQRFSCVYK